MMKEKFENAEIEVIRFEENCDVITDSMTGEIGGAPVEGGQANPIWG